MERKLIISLASGLLFAGGLIVMAQDAEDSMIVRNRNSSFYDNPISRTYTGKSPFQNRFYEPAPAPEPTPAH